MRILLVDDSKTMRSIERSVLLQLGHSDVVEACDGQDALSKVAACQPDLLLVDWNMPVMDGLEFVRQYRENHPTTPIIMVTAESEKSRVMEAIRAGVNNYVIKPFTPAILRERIRETLARRVA